MDALQEGNNSVERLAFQELVAHFLDHFRLVERIQHVFETHFLGNGPLAFADLSGFPKRGAVADGQQRHAVELAREEQAQLDRREVHRLDQDARCSREHREQPAHDQAYRRGRHQEAAVGNQAKIVLGDGERVERRTRCVMGLAEHGAVGDGAERRKGRDQDKLGAPAECVVERAAE